MSLQSERRHCLRRVNGTSALTLLLRLRLLRSISQWSAEWSVASSCLRRSSVFECRFLSAPLDVGDLRSRRGVDYACTSMCTHRCLSDVEAWVRMMKYLPATSSLPPHLPLKLIYLSNSLSTLHSLISSFFSEGATTTKFLPPLFWNTKKKNSCHFRQDGCSASFFFLCQLSKRETSSSRRAGGRKWHWSIVFSNSSVFKSRVPLIHVSVKWFTLKTAWHSINAVLLHGCGQTWKWLLRTTNKNRKTTGMKQAGWKWEVCVRLATKKEISLEAAVVQPFIQKCFHIKRRLRVLFSFKFTQSKFLSKL